MSKCEYCGKKLANKYILKNHQRTAKYCLKKQQQATNEKYSDLFDQIKQLQEEQEKLSQSLRDYHGQLVAEQAASYIKNYFDTIEYLTIEYKPDEICYATLYCWE